MRKQANKIPPKTLTLPSTDPPGIKGEETKNHMVKLFEAMLELITRQINKVVDNTY